MKKFSLSLLTISLIAIFAVSVMFTACGGSQEGKNELSDTTQSTGSQVVKQIEKMAYPLPTPFEVTKTLQTAGAGYIFDICNPVENVNKYFTDAQKAINLGIYGADLSYSSTYNKTQETTQYLKVAKQLSDALGVSSAYDEKVVARVDANLDNKDSLYAIITNSFYQTFDYLNNNEKGEISVLVLAGGLVEGLYLSTQLSEISVKNKGLIESVLNQKSSVEKMLVVLKNYEADAQVKAMMAHLNKIMDSYNNMDSQKSDLKPLTKTIAEIRNELVK